MKFLCDEMLSRLGRWLRAAGYDTRIAREGAADRDLIRLATTEGRILLTCDRKMREHKDAEGCVLLLEGSRIRNWVAQLNTRLGINWLYAPFSRCLLCNTPLKEGDEHFLGRVPPISRNSIDRVFYCPECGKPYWQGGHVRRMHEKLSRWQKQS
jgi:hypothetical protein